MARSRQLIVPIAAFLAAVLLACAVPSAGAVTGEIDTNFRASRLSAKTLRQMPSLNFTDMQTGRGYSTISAGIYETSKRRFGLVVVKYLRSGRFDRRFGKRGLVRLESSVRYAPEVKVKQLPLPDGSTVLVVIRECINTTGGCVLFTRINARGSLDTSFGQNGWVRGHLTPDAEESVDDAALAPDGKIVLVGSSFTLLSPPGAPAKGVGHGVVARYLSNGLTDASFGNGGSVSIDGDDYKAVVIDPTAAITVAGNRGNPLLARFTPSGMPDLTFGLAGSATFDAKVGSNGSASSLLLLPDGGAVGIANVNSPDDDGRGDIIFRVSAAGEVDQGFLDQNRATRNRVADLKDLALQKDGKIVAVGSIYGWPDTALDDEVVIIYSDHAFIARYLTSGAIDTGFAGEMAHRYQVGADPRALGWLSTPALGSYDSVNIDPRGRILALGPSVWATPGQANLTRHSISPRLDSSISFPRNHEPFKINGDKVARPWRFSGLVDGPTETQTIDVAITRRFPAGNCQWLTGETKSIVNGRAQSCTRPFWFKARMTSKRTWQVDLRRLPSGSYLMYSRARDANGQTERRFSSSDRTRVVFEAP